LSTVLTVLDAYILHPKEILHIETIIEMEGIKMVSGQPGPQGPYPMYQPAYQPPHKPAVEYVKTVVSDLMLSLAVVISLLLMMVGSWLIGLMDTEGGVNAGQVVKSLGMFILTVALLLGAIVRTDMEKWVRTAMIVSAAFLIAVVGFWFSYLNFNL
jgi:hypothetical protein